MALQPCRECGHEVSSEAAACPKCAAPIRPAKAVKPQGESGAPGLTVHVGLCIVPPSMSPGGEVGGYFT